MADPQKNTEPPKCAGGCGFFGNPACENFCSKCYRDRHGPDAFLGKPVGASSPLGASSVSTPQAPAMAPVAAAKAAPSQPRSAAHAAADESEQESQPASATATPGKKDKKKKKKKNRCHVCNTKLGMMSFDCRCDGVFCSKHRLPDDHECSFDFKSFDREKLAQANQVVAPDKLNRI